MHQIENRHEPRFGGQYKKMIWQKPGDEPVPALLFDFSASGAAFYVGRCPNRSLHEGEQITLHHDVPAAESQIYKVVRIQQLGFGSILVGCSRTAEVEVSQTGVRLPKLKTAVHESVVHAFRSPRWNGQTSGRLQ